MKKVFTAIVKKINIAIFLSVSVLLSVAYCFAGCQSNSVKEIIIKVNKSNAYVNSVNADFEKIDSITALLSSAGEEFVAGYSEKIKIKVVEFEEGEETKAVTDAFKTSNAADVLYDNFFNMSSYIHTGNAVPLDDVLTGEAVSSLNSKYVDSGRYNQKLYMMPYLASQNILIYNKTMLKQCGLDKYIDDGDWAISNWSVQEWTEILNTLAHRLPIGDVPFMMYAKDNQGDTYIMTLLCAYGGNIFDENDNFSLINDNAVTDALNWIQGGVDSGWYLSVPYDKTMLDNSSKFKTGELAFYSFGPESYMYSDVIVNGIGDKYGFVNYPGNKCTFFCDGFEIFDNGDSEKIAIAKDFLRYFYTTEKWMNCSAGGIPASLKITEKYKNDIPHLEPFSANAVNAIDITRNLPNWQGGADSVRGIFYKEIADLLIHDAYGDFIYTPQECAKSLHDKLNGAIEIGRANSHPHD